MQNESKKLYTTPSVASYGLLADLTMCPTGGVNHDTLLFNGNPILNPNPGPDSNVCFVSGP